jgi:Spy/CpxP family protein refolding chaperone
MKRLLCVLAAMLLVLQVGCAQEPYRHHGGQPSIDQLARELDLTSTQKTQVQQIFDGERGEREQLQSSGEDRRQQMQELQSDLITKLSAVLTPDQLQRFEQIEQQQRHHRHGFGGYGQSAPGE